MTEDDDMFSVMDVPEFKEIELMKELVTEFGEAIENRIKQDEEQVATNRSASPSGK